jgi:hypothetical protein
VNKTSINISSKVQEISVASSEIKGAWDGLNSILEIPLSVTLRDEDRFKITTISLTARLNANNACLSEVTMPFDRNIHSNEDLITVASLRFLLNEKAINTIESSRNGDVLFSVELTLLYLHGRKVNSSGITIIDWKGTDSRVCNLQIHIPKSQWVESLLKSMNYQSIKLIEIPLTHKGLKEAYDGIIIEFNAAEKYFNQKDYNKCVAHCRQTLDKLHRELANIKKHTISESNFDWFKKVTTETYNWIVALEKASFEVTSKTHHSGTYKEFTRAETESIYLVVLGLMHFIGHL